MFKIFFSSIIVNFGLFLGTTFAYTIPNAASHVKVQFAQVENIKMGPMGGSHFKLKQASTELKLNLVNFGATSVKLIAATSPVAEMVQLHDFVPSKGKLIMQQIPQIFIKPYSRDQLSYKSTHIMLIGLKMKLQRGKSIPFTLIFSDGSYIKSEAVVG